MKYWGTLLVGFVVFSGWVSPGVGEEYSLQYFMSRLNSKSEALTKQERTILIDQIHRRLERVREVNHQITHRLKTGGIEMSYQEGDYWVSRLKEDRNSIEEAIEQTKRLQENLNHLVSAVRLYKLLRDLSTNLNGLNNIPLFSGMVGDLAPELGLWTDPVFYQLYLLPLARDKNLERGPSPKTKRPSPPAKKP
ncbi:MAG: hypothetical protein N3G78_13690 [Desulfobacterota bacterium]|nr:hypothetical protein [Thermodesulfobacteriota bacterium]